MKQHNFKVGDRIRREDGQECTVQRIDPSCNNVFGKDFTGTGSYFRANGEEVSAVRMWRVVKSASDDTTPAALAYDTADLHIYTLANRGRYQGATAVHEVIAAGTAGKAKAAVEQKAQDDLRAGVTYRAVVRFWDGDVCEYTFTVEKPEPKNRVKFTG